MKSEKATAELSRDYQPHKLINDKHALREVHHFPQVLNRGQNTRARVKITTLDESDMRTSLHILLAQVIVYNKSVAFITRIVDVSLPQN